MRIGNGVHSLRMQGQRQGGHPHEGRGGRCCPMVRPDWLGLQGPSRSPCANLFPDRWRASDAPCHPSPPSGWTLPGRLRGCHACTAGSVSVCAESLFRLRGPLRRIKRHSLRSRQNGLRSHTRHLHPRDNPTSPADRRIGRICLRGYSPMASRTASSPS
jgi:hypothetical protein